MRQPLFEFGLFFLLYMTDNLILKYAMDAGALDIGIAFAMLAAAGIAGFIFMVRYFRRL